jgi:hypothetical protein
MIFPILQYGLRVVFLMVGDVASVVECLFSKCKALNSNLSTAKKQKRKKKKFFQAKIPHAIVIFTIQLFLVRGSMSLLLFPLNPPFPFQNLKKQKVLVWLVVSSDIFCFRITPSKKGGIAQCFLLCTHLTR